MRFTLKKCLTVLLSVIFVLSICITSVSAIRIDDGESFIYDFNSDNTLKVVELTTTDTDVVIPADYYGYVVTSLASTTFSNNKSIESVTLPDSMTSIDMFAFSGCTNLKKLVLSENMKAIPGFAFKNCTSLEYIYVPSSITSIAATAFNGLSNVVIYCYKDSYAHQFAVEKNISYVLIDDEPQPLLGDVNLDGVLDVRDATAMQRAIADIVPFTEEQMAVADFDGNGIFNIMDVTMVQYAIAG